MIIAIDGTASSGKSTISRELGRKLGICVLGTGSIYRAITLKTLNLSINAADDESLAQMLETTKIECRFENGVTTIIVDGIAQQKDQLNSPEVSNTVAHISCKPFVREYVRKIQKQLASEHSDIIVEGRDIGSVVFPSAEVKLFIDADVVTRAKRRYEDYVNQGKKVNLNKVIEDIKLRDDEDRRREVSPLIMTSESILVDTSSSTVEESTDKIINIMKEKQLI